MEPQHAASQWAALRRLREETESQYSRVRLAILSWNNVILSTLFNERYPDVKTLREQGLRIFRDILEDECFRPGTLEDVFAFVSLWYAISKLLAKENRIQEHEILSGLSTWRECIESIPEREAFDILMTNLWPEGFEPTGFSSDIFDLHQHLDLARHQAIYAGVAPPSLGLPEDSDSSFNIHGLNQYTTSVEQDSRRSRNTGATCVRKLTDTAVFRLVLTFSNDFGDLVQSLLSSQWISKPKKRYTAEQENQRRFSEAMRDRFFRPRYQHQAYPDAAFPALLSVAELLVELGYLKNENAIKRYLVAISTVRQYKPLPYLFHAANDMENILPSNDLLFKFMEWSMTDPPAENSTPEGLSITQKRYV
jgi:hypothetical protein